MELTILIESLKKNKTINNFEDIKQVFRNEPYNFNLNWVDHDDLYRVIYTNKSPKNKLTNTCKGIILEKETDKIVCYAFDKIPEYNEQTYKNFEDTGLDWESCRVEEAIDGSLIKLFYYNDKWNVATNKCIDANLSKVHWLTSKTFYEMFMEAKEYMKFNFDSLNKKYCYSLILMHPENRNVTVYQNPMLVHLGTRDMETLKEIKTNINLPIPGTHKFNSFDDILIHVTKLQWNCRGLMLVDKDYNRLEIENLNFNIIKNVRGNSRHVQFRYLQIRNTIDSNVFLTYYPEYRMIVEDVEKKIFDHSQNIYRAYVNKHIQHIPITPFHKYKKILYEIHGQYLKTRVKITFSSVFEKISNLPAKRIAHLLNE